MIEGIAGVRALYALDARLELPARPRPEAAAAIYAVTERQPAVLVVVDDDPDAMAVLREALHPHARWVRAARVPDALKLAAEQPIDLILCDASLAFGLAGLLAQLPLDVASRVFVLADSSEVVDARWRLQGSERILTKPLERWLVEWRVSRAASGIVNLLWAPDVARVAAPARPRRTLTEPHPAAPFSVLLADVDEQVHEALRRVFREDARHVLRSDPEAAAELALSTPFHTLVCSMKAALHPRSFLDGIAREDPAGADRVLVVAPARDVPYVRHTLERMGRTCTVLALPIDDTTLRREIFRAHPALAARVAARDVAQIDEPDSEREDERGRDGHASRALSPPRYRRLAVLVVDDDATTQILFHAAAPHENADVALATTPMEAFEHVVTRAVDLLVVSATMRGDGGEPFYRVLWRLRPELKTRCLLVLASSDVPESIPRSVTSRIVEKPLTRDAIARAVEQALSQGGLRSRPSGHARGR